MLKLGCMSLSYKDEFAANQLDLEQFIERAYQLGLDGIDIHTRAFTSLDPAYLRSIRMQAFRRGIALSYIGVSSNFGKPQDELDAKWPPPRSGSTWPHSWGFRWCGFLPRGFPKASAKRTCGRG